MEHRTLSALAVFCVLLAGCQAAPGATPGRSTETPAWQVAAPGVNRSGVAAPARLADAHRRALEGRSYTLRVVIRTNRSDGTGRWTLVQTLRVGPEHERTVYRQESIGEPPRAVRPQTDIRGWSTANRTMVAITRQGVTVYRNYSYDPVWGILHGDAAIESYLDDLDGAEVERTDYGGWVAYRIEADLTLNESDPRDDGAVVAIVDSFGLLRALSMTGPPEQFLQLPESYWTEWGPLRVSLRYTDVGNTTVERPGWVDRAINETGSAG